MFEVTTRLPNSFAFKNNPRLHSTNTSKLASPFSTSDSLSPRRSSRDLPIYFNQPRHSIDNTFTSSSNSKINHSSYYYDHDMNKQPKNNITVLPVYYKNELPSSHTNLPSLRHRANSPSLANPTQRSPSYINKIQINGSQLLPPLSNMGANRGSSLGSAQSYSSMSSDNSSNFHEQLQAHQRRLNSLDRINLSNPQGRSHSLNMNRYNNLTSNNGNQVIYSHDSSNFPNSAPVDTANNKISVIKSIKARQDMFLSKNRRNSEEEEENNRMRYHFGDAKKSRIEDQNELNLIKRNFNYLFLNNSKNLTNNFKNSENLSQAEANYRNTLNNTDRKLKSLRERQHSLDRLRMEQSETPMSDTSSITSNQFINKFSNSKPGSGNSESPSNAQKSILVKKNKRFKEKKSVSFAEV